MNLSFKKLDPDAVTPLYATDGAACFDLVALIGKTSICLAPRESKVVSTGLSFEVPEGYVMLVYSRSGHGFKSGVRLANCVGVIDSDYRGEVMVKLTNDGDLPFFVATGDRVAQALLMPVQQWELTEALELTDTARGTAGLGSTGK